MATKTTNDASDDAVARELAEELQRAAGGATFITVDQVAKLLGMSKSGIYKMRMADDGPWLSYGRALRTTPYRLAVHLVANRREAPRAA